MKALALLSLTTALTLCSVTAQAEDIAAGEQTYRQNCAHCHGNEGKGMASFPALVGRDATYISERLIAYRASETVGTNSALMYAWAGPLSDDDIANLAAYISTTFE